MFNGIKCKKNVVNWKYSTFSVKVKLKTVNSQPLYNQRTLLGWVLRSPRSANCDIEAGTGPSRVYDFVWVLYSPRSAGWDIEAGRDQLQCMVWVGCTFPKISRLRYWSRNGTNHSLWFRIGVTFPKIIRLGYWSRSVTNQHHCSQHKIPHNSGANPAGAESFGFDTSHHKAHHWEL